MRKLILAVSAAALVAAPALAMGEENEAQQKEKPGLLSTVAGAVGGVVASTAGTAAGGPLGGAAAGLAGQKVGKSVGGAVGKVFGGKKDKDEAALPPAEPPSPEAPMVRADAREIAPPPLAVPRATAPSADAVGADASAVAPMPESLPQQIPPETDSGSGAPPPDAEVLDVRATPD